MKILKLIGFILAFATIQGCSAPSEGNQKEETAVPETEEAETVDNSIESLVDDIGERLTDEGIKITEDLVNSGKDKVNSVINDILKSTENDSIEEVVSSGTTEQIPVTVKSIKDGDTIVVEYNGQAVDLRYLLMDTPESVHPSKPVQPFSIEASKRNEELLNSGQVTIEFDVGERFDRYNRLLAYVYVDGVSVNETLIKEGLARVAYIYPPNTRYVDHYKKAEQEAKEQGLGIWSIENYADNEFDM